MEVVEGVHCVVVLYYDVLLEIRIEYEKEGELKSLHLLQVHRDQVAVRPGAQSAHHRLHFFCLPYDWGENGRGELEDDIEE